MTFPKLRIKGIVFFVTPLLKDVSLSVRALLLVAGYANEAFIRSGRANGGLERENKKEITKYVDMAHLWHGF